MFVQWCLKGIRERDDFDDTAAQAVFKKGLLSNWMRNDPSLGQDVAAEQRRSVLTPQAVYDHVNNYAAVQRTTPYISLSAGCIERDKYLATNVAHPAATTAFAFATDGGQGDGYVFVCWVVLSMNPAPTVEGVAEEVRELNTYTSYSTYQTEGEVAAKVHVPGNQIQCCIKIAADLTPQTPWTNADFTPPDSLANIRNYL